MTVATDAVLEFPDFTLHTLAPGIYAAIAKRMTGSVANAGIIDLGDRTLVFDTFMCVPAARDLASAALQFTGRPATYVVNSHPHPDHVHGNIAFGEAATIVATQATRADRLARGELVLGGVRQAVTAGLEMARQQAAAATDEAQRLAAQAAIAMNESVLNGLPTPDELRYPTLTFEQQLTLHGSARSAHLITWGGGHSPSDSVLWLPAERIAFTADVVTSGSHLVLDGDPEQWLHILDQVDGLQAATIVPGHGQVQGPDATAPVRQYLIDLLDLAARAARDGITPESVAQVAIPEAYQALAMPQVFTQTLARLLRRLG